MYFCQKSTVTRLGECIRRAWAERKLGMPRCLDERQSWDEVVMMKFGDRDARKLRVMV